MRPNDRVDHLIPVEEEYQQSGAVDRGEGVIRSAGLSVCWPGEKGRVAHVHYQFITHPRNFPSRTLRSRFPSFLGSSTLSLDPSLAISLPLSLFLSSFFDPRKEGPFSERRGGDNGGYITLSGRERERVRGRS